MNAPIVGFTLGILINLTGLAMAVPFIVELVDHGPNVGVFFEAMAFSVFLGTSLILANKHRTIKVTRKSMFLLTAMSWLTVSAVAAIPLYASNLDISFTDAFFEAVSGITTTGSTILSGLDGMSRGILLWRSIIQWIGGMGLIAFAIVFLPFLRIGGMELFHTESSDRSDKIMPRASDMIFSLVKVYCLLTLACFVTYHQLGMGMFEAVNHALTTICTGGYSTHDASFGYYDSYALHMAASFFMLLGGLPFVLYVRFLFQGRFAFFEDTQFKTILAVLAILIAIMTMWLWTHDVYSFADSFRYAAFNIVSVITTTGYATADYMQWGGFAVMFMFFITYLGCCTGSTSGGIKIMRLITLQKAMSRLIKSLIVPNGIFTMTYENKRLPDEVVNTVLGFLFLFVVSNAVLTIALLFVGLDFESAISGAATALANVGPGIGSIIGPAGNFQPLPDSAKWLLCIGMLVGRLEIMTVAVLFSSLYWRK